ncbi:DsrE family protein [Shewanella sp. AS16]|nr:DsrE family protein [Shewanella sp. AS16]MCE9686451.1 DsrE family protein [Shewanella sp. AS16]
MKSNMKLMRSTLVLGLGLLLSPLTAMAGLDAFQPGPVFKTYGRIAKVDTSWGIPQGMKFKVVFDMSKAAQAGELNPGLDSMARFINMHVAAGVKPEDIELAMVVHGAAVVDLSNQAFYARQHDGSDKVNANAALIKALSAQGVHFYVCGQSAAYYGLGREALLLSVDMALSAMTAHAVLAGSGYSLNPF